MAEAEVMSRDKVHRVILPDEKFRDKVLPRHGHHVPVERLDKDLLHAVLCADDVCALRRRRQQRHGLSRDEFTRRAVERERRGAAAALLCAAHRHFEQFAVPDMHPVEKAQGDDCGFIHSFGFLFASASHAEKISFRGERAVLRLRQGKERPVAPVDAVQPIGELCAQGIAAEALALLFSARDGVGRILPEQAVRGVEQGLALALHVLERHGLVDAEVRRFRAAQRCHAAAAAERLTEIVAQRADVRSF